MQFARTVDQRMPIRKKLEELGISKKNIKRKRSPNGDKVRKEAEKGIRTGKPKPPKRKPQRRK